MKNIILISIIALSLQVKAQEAKFKGIGELKVGETTIAFIDELAAKSKKKIKKLPNFASSDDANYSKYIVEYVKPVNKCSDATNPIVPEHRVFVVYNYSVMDQYLSPKIFLEFYNNVLYHFIVSEPRFVPEFKTKYGEPVTDEIHHDGKCDKDAPAVAALEKDIIESWDDANIHAAHMITSTRANADCEKVIKTKFEIMDMATNKAVQMHEHEALKRCQENEVADKKVVVPNNF